MKYIGDIPKTKVGISFKAFGDLEAGSTFTEYLVSENPIGYGNNVLMKIDANTSIYIGPCLPGKKYGSIRQDTRCYNINKFGTVALEPLD